MTPDDMEGRLEKLADWFSQITDAVSPVSSSQAAKDLRALLLDYRERGRVLDEAASPAQEGETVADDLLHKTIKRLKSHVVAMSDGKKLVAQGLPGPTPNPIMACLADLPEIVRHLEAAEFEIDSALERYEDQPVVPVGREDARKRLIGLLIEARPAHKDWANMCEITPDGADAILAALRPTDTGRE
jgi:hypothetical protein